MRPLVTLLERTVPEQHESTVPLLAVRNVSVSIGSSHIVRDVSFDIRTGEVVGLVGESGCGKSMTALTLMGLQNRLRSARTSGEILFEGADMLRLRRGQLRELSGNRIGMIFQEPMSALDPVFTAGEQISEVVRTHRGVSRAVARKLALDALAQVDIPDPVQRYDSYPHQLSGGMRQRVMIAMAIICEPKLLIADEPTTALDVTIQAQIVTLLRSLCERTGMALLLVTHDLGLVAQNCERVLTMYAGQIIEHGPTAQVLSRPAHPYTSGLLRAIPGLAPRKTALATIAGQVMPPTDMRPGCRFEPRCTHAADPCRERQEMRVLDGARAARCCRATELSLPGLWA